MGYDFEFAVADNLEKPTHCFHLWKCICILKLSRHVATSVSARGQVKGVPRYKPNGNMSIDLEHCVLVSEVLLMRIRTQGTFLKTYHPNMCFQSALYAMFGFSRL